MHLVRTSWDITYTITKAKSGYITLVTSSTDTMENRMKETMPYDFVYNLEGSLCPSEFGSSTITQVKLPDHAPVTEGFPTDENKNQSFTKRIPMEPGKKYTFDVTTSECKRESDFSLFYAKCPVMKVTLTVLGIVEDFDVSLELTFFHTVPKFGEVTVDGKKGRQWIIDKPIPPMLPGQGFLLKWSPKQPLASASLSS